MKQLIIEYIEQRIIEINSYYSEHNEARIDELNELKTRLEKLKL